MSARGLFIRATLLGVAACSGDGTTTDGAGGGLSDGATVAANGATNGASKGSGFDAQSGANATGAGGGGECATFSQKASTIQPADIIIAVDTSGSMVEELPWVQENVATIAGIISASGIDAHVVVIGSQQICIPAPLGSGQCGIGGANGFADENLPGLKRLTAATGGEAVLGEIVRTYGEWKSVLRPDASKTFVVITDEDSVLSTAAEFTAGVLGLDPTFQGFKFDAIYAYQDFSAACPAAITEGHVFRELVAQTGGVEGDLCLQDFDPVFADIGTQVIVDAEVDCDFAIPPPPAGETLDFGKVNVAYAIDGGASQQLFNVPGGAAACGPAGGWYYDDPQSPSLIVLCPATCDAVNGAQSSQIDVLFGCATVVVPA